MLNLVVNEFLINKSQKPLIMKTTNKVQLTGNLGNDPELKTLDNGKKVVRFSMATNEEYTTKTGEKNKEVQWHTITAWGKLADKISGELTKGAFVSIEGRLHSSNYVDKDGIKRYSTEIVANEFVVNKKPQAAADKAG
jgi:single-strand DNA-binding protein